MSRDLPAAINTAINSNGNALLALLVELEFSSGFLRIWSGVGTIQYQGNTYTGAGTLFGFDNIQESLSVVANGCTIYLSGIPSDLVSACINDAEQGKIGRIYLAVLNSDFTMNGDPVEIFVGRLDVPTILDDGENCIISISYESRLIDLMSPREFRYTNENQKVLNPGDPSFEFVTTIQDKTITWGRG